MKEKYNLKNIDLVILAGGKGTRISKLLGKYPKPMLKFNNKHFVQYIFNNVCKYNFKRIIILCGYRHNVFFKKFHNKNINFTKIVCVREKKLLGTGGALANLIGLRVNDFVLINGDTLFDVDIKLLVNSLDKNRIGITALTKNKNQKSKKLNNLILKKNIIGVGKNSSLMNGGVYFFKKKIFKYIKKGNFSLENDLLPKFIKEKMINGKIFKNFFIDIGSRYYFKAAKNLLKKQYKKPAIFLDRDGVINYDYGYVHKIENFKFRPGVLNGLKYLIKKNYNIFIVTNQAGLGKQIFTEENFFKLHKKIKEKLEKLNIFFNDVQYSPFHPKAKTKKYRKNLAMRKPGNKMIKNIKFNWDIDGKKSFMIGDKKTDKLAAKKSKLKFYYVEQNFYKQVKSIVNSY
jgi:D-glycero-D-manno-heptose 1,7-bisphosphate phosphatase|tara:strand:- start:5 stop:1207 length:1203 start_codon:yes stop_codon:yes gene_type:complete